jgi:hypothetical protein
LLNADDQALPGQTVVFCASASLWLQYVSGDGQETAPGTPVPHPLEVRVANGTDGIAGAMLRYTVEQGGGSVVGPMIAATDAHGLASIAWQLGTSGSHRLRVELIDSDGQVLQRQSFNASAAVPATARSGCDITIGKGGDFENLDRDLLARLLQPLPGSACICFLPGTHDIGPLEVNGRESRLSLHGCGHASALRLRAALTLSGFAALDLSDLVIQAEGELGVMLEQNNEVRLTAVQIDRRAQTPCLRIVGAQRVSMSGCEIRAVGPTTPAVVFEEINGDCQVAHNRFVGVVSFYGDPAGVPTNSVLQELSRTDRGARLDPVQAQLTFCNNSVSLLAVGEAVTRSLSALPPAPPAASGLFQTATVAGNTITQPLNLFVASRMIAVSSNTLLAPGADNVYGLFIAERATAVGNLTMLPAPGAPPLMFVAQNFEKAANVAIVQP